MEHELALEHHELLEAAAVDAGIQHTPAFHRTGPHEHHRRREAAVDRRWRRDSQRLTPRTFTIGREDFDALQHDQALAIVVRSGLFRGVRAVRSGHRAIDGVVDVAFDDQEAGESAGDLVVRRAVRVRVIPVGPRRVRNRHGRRARLLPPGTDRVLVTAFADAFVGIQRTAAGVLRRPSRRAVSQRQDARVRVVAERAVRVHAWIDVQPMRVDVARVRSMRHVDRPGQARRVAHGRGHGVQQVVSMFESDRQNRGRRLAVDPQFFVHRAQRRFQHGRFLFERIGRGSDRDFAEIRRQVIAQRDLRGSVARIRIVGPGLAPLKL